MSQMKIEDVQKTRVVINGIKQNCYMLDCRDTIGVNPRPNTKQEKFFSLEESLTENGTKQEIVEKDYPINSESVSSYVESSDYRNDPLQAIANAPKRVNLGDISDVQEFLQNNPVEATLQYAGILDKVSAYFKDMAKKQKKAINGLSPAPAPASPAPASSNPVENGGTM